MSDKLREAAKAALYEFRNAEWDGWNPIIKKLEAALAETTVKNSLKAQRPWVGLTGPEVDEAYKSVSDKEWAIGGLTDARVFFCAIEAKLREKNND